MTSPCVVGCPRYYRDYFVFLRKLVSGSVLLLLAALTACDSSRDEQDDFERQAFAPPDGYTHTNESGVISEDPDDWRTPPVFSFVVQVEPARPNPVGTGFINLSVTLVRDPNFRGGLLLAAREGGTGDLFTLEPKPQATMPGLYVFTFPVGALGRSGLHRVWLFAGSGEVISYGDILVE
jgi:hypothetical protein